MVKTEKNTAVALRAYFKTNDTIASGVPRTLVAVVVFIFNRPFYPASSLHPVSVLIPYPREILIMWSQAVRQRKTNEKN